MGYHVNLQRTMWSLWNVLPKNTVKRLTFLSPDAGSDEQYATLPPQGGGAAWAGWAPAAPPAAAMYDT